MGLFCKHKHVSFVRNIGGDEMLIHHHKTGLAKSEWVCKKCDSLVYRGERFNG